MDDLPPPEPEPNSAAVPHARPTSAKFDDLLRELEEQVPETQFAPPPADEMEWSPVPAPAPPKVADTIGEAPAPIGAAPAPARILDPIDEASTVSVDSDETQPLDTRRRRPAGPAPEVTVTIVPVPNEPEEIEEAEEEAPRQVKGKRKAEEQPSAAKKKPSPAKSPAKSSAPTPRSRSPSPVGGRKLPGWMTGEAVKKSPRAAKPKADKEEGKAKPAARTPRTKKAAKDDEEGDLMDFDPFAAGVDGTQEDSQAFFRDPLLSKPAGAAAKKDAGEFKAPERPDPIEETPPTQEMHPALKKADTLSQLIDMYAGTQQGTQH
ncbi:hypothetical protein DFJ74DRAFT_670229 [Hyaloraphidium curvatum]|nr:hypothetical protein DFJ74DRAFT_670229 [Hyaloraphidium curvatum]